MLEVGRLGHYCMVIDGHGEHVARMDKGHFGGKEKMKRILAFVVLALIAVVIPAHAHHSFAMFDMEKETVYVGTVVSYTWENPHSHIIIKVAPGAKDPSTVGTWDIEGGSVNIMGRQGWNRATFKPGDPITLVAHPMKDSSKGASLFFAVMPDGQRIYHDIARPSADQEKIITKELADAKSESNRS